MSKLIGRVEPKKRLLSHHKSSKSDFVAIYGRRRVGKTFLIRKTFENKFHFQHTALANANMHTQLAQFHASLLGKSTEIDWLYPTPQDWFQAFGNLSQYIESIDHDEKKVIFLDELPWMDTQNSKFLSALEHFWNSWASVRLSLIHI